jgi:Tol biopolymer transport system component
MAMRHLAVAGMTRMRCRLELLLVIFLLRGAPVASQETKPLPNAGDPRLAGQIYSPLFCPSNPDLVAYERQIEDIQELYLYHYQTGEIQQIRAVGEVGSKKEDPFQSLFQAQRLDDFARFEGQLDWRPQLDDKQRQWFVFVSNGGAKSFDLYLSYVDRYGRMANEPTLHLTHDGVDQYPKWSPDGNSLVFVSGDKSGSDLFLASNMTELLRRGDAKLFRPVNITYNPDEDNYPAWSPDGKAIAYQSYMRDGALLNMGINLINVDEITNSAPRSIRLTADLGSYHEYNPSWSAKGNYIAYYISQARVDQGEGNRLLDIGVLTVIPNAKTRRIESGRSIQGTSPRLAKNVIPNRNAGPCWGSRCPEEASANTIFYVKRDEKNLNPIITANFVKWQNLNFDYENPVVKFSTRLHRDVTLTQFKLDNKDGFTRFAYVSQVQNANQLQIQETRLASAALPACILRFAPELFKTAPALTSTKDDRSQSAETTVVKKAGESEVKASPQKEPPQKALPQKTSPQINKISTPKSKSKATALTLSFIFPGAGQLYKGQTGKGLLFVVAGAAALGASYKFRKDYQDEEGQYFDKFPGAKNGSVSIDQVENAKIFRDNRLKPAANKANLALGAAAAIWSLNIIDSALSSPRSMSRQQYRLEKFGAITFPESDIRYHNGAWFYTVGVRLDF